MTDKNFHEIAKKLKPIDLPPLDENPLVSVLIGNYNYGRYIGQALDSVLQQTYPNFEVIVCDDGSTDKSREVVARYCDRDARIRLVANKENRGQVYALNGAYAPSRGEIVCFLDSDDVFLPQKLEEVVGAFKKRGRSGVCFHRHIKMNKDGRTFSYARPMLLTEGWVGLQALRSGGQIFFTPGTSGLSLRRPIADLLFPVHTRLLTCVDGYLFMTAQFFTEIVALKAALTKLRIHGENIGSGDIFTATSIRHCLKYLSIIHDMQKEFLAIHYGSEVAERLRLEDMVQYWEYLMVLHILTGGRSPETQGLSLRTVIEHIHPYRRRLLARVLLALPASASRRALEYWCGSSKEAAAVAWAARFLLRI